MEKKKGTAKFGSRQPEIKRAFQSEMISLKESLRGEQMAGKKRSDKKKPIEQYDHRGKKRVNNPPVGLVTPDTDKETGNKRYAYDPHIDPSLQWAGKAEHTSFEMLTVFLHVHGRIDPGLSSKRSAKEMDKSN